MISWTKAEMRVLPIAFLIMLLITISLGVLLRNKSDRLKEIPLQVIAVIVVILEVIKQIRNIVIGFDTWALPLHYCSIFVFFFPLAQLTSDKFKDFMKPVAFIPALTVTLIFYLYPTGIIGNACEGVFATFNWFHTFMFHHLVLLYSMLTIALNNCKPKKKDCLNVFIVMFVYFVISISFAYILNTNYCNLLNSVIPILESLRINCGQLIYSIVIFAGVVGGTTAVSFLYYYFYKIADKIKIKIENKR